MSGKGLGFRNELPDEMTDTAHLHQEVMARRRMIAALEQEAEIIIRSRNDGVSSQQYDTKPEVLVCELHRAIAECQILSARLATAEQLRKMQEAESKSIAQSREMLVQRLFATEAKAQMVAQEAAALRETLEVQGKELSQERATSALLRDRLQDLQVSIREGTQKSGELEEKELEAQALREVVRRQVPTH